VPDSIDEFSLEGIRRGVNFYFPGAIPLPRSIAAVFAWQASNSFSLSGIKNGDLVLVLDNGPDGGTITPLIGSHSSAQNKVLPESKGILWERHPSIPITATPTTKLAQKVLEKLGSPLPRVIANLLGFEGLSDERNALSFVDENWQWYNLSSKIKELLHEEGVNNRITLDDINHALTCIPGVHHDRKIFLLTVGKSINLPETTGRSTCLREPISLTEGGHTLSHWQHRAGELPLWRDHLPELSIEALINGHWDRFFIVKDATVTPQKGKQVQIPVKESFTLQAGKEHYTFPLHQGTGGRKLKYMVYLKCSAFPLKRDTVCHLKMTYTYGADDPYELVFESVNPAEAEFKYVRTEWREFQHDDASNPIFPQFPKRYEWSELQSFPRKEGRSSDLLDWIKRDLSYIGLIATNGRCTSSINSPWKTDKNGLKYCFTVDGTLLHQDGFEPKLKELLNYGDKVSYYKIGYNNRCKGVDITVNETSPQRCFLHKSIRFPMLTVWSHSRSLSDLEMPQDFRMALTKGISDCLLILQRSDLPQSIRMEAFFFLSCLHKNTPAEISQLLVTKFSQISSNINDMMQYFDFITISIGGCEVEWQKKLLDQVINIIEYGNNESSSIGLQMLSIAIWRSEELIKKLSNTEIEVITSKL